MFKKSESTSDEFVNVVKKARAEEIYRLVTNTKAPKTDGEIYNKDRFIELMKEDGVDAKDKETTIFYIYQKLGGAVISKTEAAAKKVAARKPRTLARTAKTDDDDEGETADADDDDDE